MKRVWIAFVCLLLPCLLQGLTFVPSEIIRSTDANFLRISPRSDKQEEPTAVLFVKTDIAHVDIYGNIIGKPRRVRNGYVLFIPHNTTRLQLSAPLYTSQTLTFSPVLSGHHYEMTLSTLENQAAVRAAEQSANTLDLKNTRVGVNLDFDYMDVTEAGHKKNQTQALVYLDKTLNFAQWQKLLMPKGAYEPFDTNGNTKNPCCILVPDGEPIENVFKMRVVEMDSYVENLEGGNTYHAVLTLTPKN